MHPAPQLRPIPRQAVHLQHILTQPAPQLLDRVEPRRIRRQPHRLDPRPLLQGGHDVRVTMDRPVVLDRQQSRHVAIGPVQLFIHRDDLGTSHDVAVEVVDLAGHRVERADDSPQAIGAPGPFRPRRRTGSGLGPIARRIGPAGIAHLVEEHQRYAVGRGRRLMQARVKILLFTEVLGIGAVVLGHPRTEANAAAFQATPHAAEGHPVEDVAGGADGPQRPATRRRAGLCDGHLPPCLLAGPLPQSLDELLFAVKDASHGNPPGDGRSAPRFPKIRTSRAMSRRYRDHAASAAPAWRPDEGRAPRRSSASPRHARGRRDGGRDSGVEAVRSVAPRSEPGYDGPSSALSWGWMHGVAPQTTVVTPPRLSPGDLLAWEDGHDASARPRAAEAPGGSTTPASSTDDRSAPPPSLACAPATSVRCPPGSPAADSRAPNRSCTRTPPGTSRPSATAPCGPAPGHDAPTGSSRRGTSR